MSKKPNIAFFGTPDVAVWVLEALKEKGVTPDLVIAAPDAPKGRKLVMTAPAAKVWAEKNGVAVLQPESLKSDEFARELRSRAPSSSSWDLFIVAAYGKLIPENILNIPKRGTINVHPSLLPLLRGPSPLQTAILEDMKDTGVTIMRLDKEIDHGPILAQRKLASDHWPMDSLSLGKSLARSGGELIAEILPSILSGKTKETKQDHSKATFTQKISKEDGLIDLSADAYKNWLSWNAYKGWPGAFFFKSIRGKKTRVVMTEASYENGSFIIKKVIPEGGKEISFQELERIRST